MMGLVANNGKYQLMTNGNTILPASFTHLPFMKNKTSTKKTHLGLPARSKNSKVSRPDIWKFSMTLFWLEKIPTQK